jgi:hypothetical protein
MAFKGSKQKFSKDEIIDILKRNVSLFKDEEEFVQYIVDLALFLVENRLLGGTELPAGEKGSSKRRAEKTKGGEDYFPPGPIEGLVGPRRKDLRRTRTRDEELYGVLKKHATKAESPICRMCGAETNGRAVCPMCGNMTF